MRLPFPLIPSLADLLPELYRSLESLGDTPQLDAQVLLAHVLEKPRAWVLAHPEAGLTEDQNQELEKALARLRKGEPLPYILGHWEFFGLDFIVTPAVLIPRPETELLVEQALQWLRDHPDKCRVAEAGTGSGCVAISLATRITSLQVTATDLSKEALQIALLNAERRQLAGRITFVESNLLQGVDGQFDLICANLPYIPSSLLESLEVAVYEPLLALDGGTDGLDLIRQFMQDAPRSLAPGGQILLEIDALQGEDAQRIARQAFPQTEVQVLSDLSGRERLLIVG